MHLRSLALCAVLLVGNLANGDTTNSVNLAAPATPAVIDPGVPGLPPLPTVRPRRARTNSIFYANTNVALAPGTNGAAASPYTVSSAPVGIVPSGWVNYPAAIQWDSKWKEFNPAPGTQSLPFSFLLTNVWTNAVTIRSAQTSCGCTVAQLPSTPWVLKPGEGGELKGTVNLAGKFGSITKSVTLQSDVGSLVVSVHINIPTPDPTAMREGQRSRNLQVAAADRQAVFRGDCATCHVSPTVGKLGKELYASACGVCHEGPNRASMVPDLHKPKVPTGHDYWTAWVNDGKAGSLMPAFARASGGILDTNQVTSLVAFLESPEFASATNAPTHAAATAPVPAVLRASSSATPVPPPVPAPAVK